jgi:hypothetical protein
VFLVNSNRKSIGEHYMDITTVIGGFEPAAHDLFGCVERRFRVQDRTVVISPASISPLPSSLPPPERSMCNLVQSCPPVIHPLEARLLPAGHGLLRSGAAGIALAVWIQAHSMECLSQRRL